MSNNLAFDSQYRTQVLSVWQDWWQDCLEVPQVMCEGYPAGWMAQHPDAPPRPNRSFTSRHTLEMPIEAVLDRFQEALEASFFVGNALCKFFVNIRHGILAAFLGANDQLLPDANWFSPPINQEAISWESIPLDRLQLKVNRKHLLWQRVYDLTRAVLCRETGIRAIGMTAWAETWIC